MGVVNKSVKVLTNRHVSVRTWSPEAVVNVTHYVKPSPVFSEKLLDPNHLLTRKKFLRLLEFYLISYNAPSFQKYLYNNLFPCISLFLL